MKFVLSLLITITTLYSANAQTSAALTSGARLVQLEGSISGTKTILNWTIAGNESADKFEIEKSTDGKNFSMAALVFGTDKANLDAYMFYEKAATKKMFYRIKIVEKNQQASYTNIIVVDAQK